MEYAENRSNQSEPNMDQKQVVAMAYVPWQHLTSVYETAKAFQYGTLFPELDKPWNPGGCKR